MSKKTQLPDAQRRKFLGGSLAAATGVAAASTIAGSTLAGIAGEEKSAEPPRQEGYRLTKHIADYYKSAAV